MSLSQSQSLTIIRGLPGSGKSTLARLIQNFGNFHTYHYEADMYMVDENNQYKFDPEKLAVCHKTCLQNTKEMLNLGHSVIVSNTFTQIWEMQHYLNYAKALGIPIQIIHCQGNFQNVHGVPDSKIAQMKARWESFSL